MKQHQTQWHRLWEVSKGLLQAPPDRGFASTLADFLDASGLKMFMEQASDFREEEILGGVIGLVYTTELFSASPEAKSDCVRQLSGSEVHESQLDCFIDFGEHLLSNGFQSTGGGGDRDNMTDEIEDGWWEFCTARGVQVDTKVKEKYPLLPAEDEAEVFSIPYRRKEKKKKKKSESTTGDESAPSSSSSSSSSSKTPTRHMEFSCESVPKFFELAHRILHSDFFVSLPLENLGHNYRRFCKERMNPDGWVKAYSEIAEAEVVLPVDWFRAPPENSYPLLRSQLTKLVEGVRSNGRGTLLRALLTARPPQSMLPHLYAVVDCTAHARLWLSGIDQTIYMESELTYAELGQRSAAKEQEEEVYASIYLHERVPSCVELVQRFQCHSRVCGWGRDMEVLVLSEQDYDTLKVPNDDMWRAVRKHIRYSIHYKEGMKVYPGVIFRNVVHEYRRLLDADRKWAKLHPSLGGSQLEIPLNGFCSSPAVFCK